MSAAAHLHCSFLPRLLAVIRHVSHLSFFQQSVPNSFIAPQPKSCPAALPAMPVWQPQGLGLDQVAHYSCPYPLMLPLHACAPTLTLSFWQPLQSVTQHDVPVCSHQRVLGKCGCCIPPADRPCKKMRRAQQQNGHRRDLVIAWRAMCCPTLGIMCTAACAGDPAVAPMAC